MVTSNVKAVYDGQVGNRAYFVSHGVVYLILVCPSGLLQVNIFLPYSEIECLDLDVI